MNYTDEYNISRLWPKDQSLSRISLGIADQWAKDTAFGITHTHLTWPQAHNPAHIQLCWNFSLCLQNRSKCENQNAGSRILSLLVSVSLPKRLVYYEIEILLTGKWIESMNYQFRHL